MAKKFDLEKIRKELAEVQAEKANVAARIAELDRRLNDDSSTLGELRAAGDEIADQRHYSRALEQREVGLTSQLKQAEEAEKQARLAALHEGQGEVKQEFREAVEQLAAGPMKALLDGDQEIRAAGGHPRTRDERKVIDGVHKYLRIKWMREHRDAGEMMKGLLN